MNRLHTSYESTVDSRLKEREWPLRQPPNPEAVEKSKRRQFTAAYKLRILGEADTLTGTGACALGELGHCYVARNSTPLTSWRRQRAKRELAALSPRSRGRKAKPIDVKTRRIIELEQENQRLLERLRHAEAIIEVQKKVAALLNGPPGEQREIMMNAAQELAITIGAAPACRVLGLARASFYRQSLSKPAAANAGRRSARALSERERQDVLEVLHSERFVDQAPREVYATLLDDCLHARSGRTYLCSVSTIYRLLAEQGEVRERRNQLVHPAYAKAELLATAPNQVRS